MAAARPPAKGRAELNRRARGSQPVARSMGERFDVVERRLVAIDARISAFEASIAAKIGALKKSIEAREGQRDRRRQREYSSKSHCPEPAERRRG